jgi:hypothetical protein
MLTELLYLLNLVLQTPLYKVCQNSNMKNAVKSLKKLH